MARRKRKVSEPSRTHTLVVQDRSGSMAVRTEATISGYNEFISGLKRDAEGEVLVTLVQFDSGVNTRYAAMPIADVPELTRQTYVIGGMTALNDAVAEAIRDVEPRVRKGDKVNVTIMTDGQENASVEYKTKESIAALLDKKREDGWEFNFLGAGEAAWSGAGALGIGADNSIFYGADAQDHAQVFRAAAMSNVATTRGLSSAYSASSPLLKVELEAKAQKKEDDADKLRNAARVIGRR
jgi:uncharacterized protein YegL